MSENNESRRGGISVDIEHLFPIIKKWLYSDKEIFLREIVSNASDAITKLNRLSSLGEVRDLENDFRIDVILDPDEGTLSVCDNGIGMTQEEVSRYLCQIALSGAMDFISKYEGENAEGSGIIGHFGLGFYSAFMVSDKVDVYTRSYTGAPAVHFSCNGEGDYEMTEISAQDAPARGTRVVMHITADEEEYLNAGKVREMLDKYCAFMPYEIYFTDLGEKEEPKQEAEEQKEGEQTEKPAPKPINDTHPLWQKSAAECTEQDYKDFYQKVFHDYREPLFYIHINADYPLNFKGILYFPRLNQHMDSMEGQIKLYYNQVFVADHIKELLPEHLTMLRGVLDCPELPLNVSRSYLQNSAYAAKIGQHISKKVADKLTGMFQNDRENYEKLWGDLKTFVEYASLRERKFYDRVKDCVIYASVEDEAHKYLTLSEYLELAKKTNDKTVYYTTDPIGHSQYIRILRAQNVPVITVDTVLESQFIQMVEQTNEGVHFVRVDADISGALKEEGESVEDEALTKLFRDVSGNAEMKVTPARLKDETVPAIATVEEQALRMEEMMRMYQLHNGTDMAVPPQQIALTVNTNNALIQRLQNESDDEKAKRIAAHIYHLALLSQRQLTAEELNAFLQESYQILGQI